MDIPVEIWTTILTTLPEIDDIESNRSVDKKVAVGIMLHQFSLICKSSFRSVYRNDYWRKLMLLQRIHPEMIYTSDEGALCLANNILYNKIAIIRKNPRTKKNSEYSCYVCWRGNKKIFLA